MKFFLLSLLLSLQVFAMDMLNGHELLRQVNKDDCAADATVLQISSVKELEEKQRQWYELWMKLLGGLPERTPLHPQVTGKIHRQGFTVEKVLFQSQPGIYVTGLLYLPSSPSFKAPYPAVLLLSGHSEAGKLGVKYHKMAVMTVRAGFAVFCPDPISQGERRQRQADFQWTECAGEHASLGARSWLLGWNFARFRLWDAMRAVDYMETRPELDISRLGVIGSSGGGTMSTYMQALDDRVKVACPGNYLSSLREVIGERGIHDAEQFFYGQLPAGLNHAAMLAMGQPRVALQINAQHSDYFPFPGTETTMAVLKKLREKLQIKTACMLFSCDGPHGWAYANAFKIISFLKYTIKGERDDYWTEDDEVKKHNVEILRNLPDVFPEELTEFTAPEGNVTVTGHVRDLPGFKSLYALLAEEGERLQRSRKIDRSRLPEIVRRRANIRPLEALPPEPEPFIHDFKWWYLAGSEGFPVELHAAILAAAGRSLIGERAEHFLRQALEKNRENGGRPVALEASGDWCIAAAHAYAAEPQLFDRVIFNDPPTSWTDMLKCPDPANDSFAVTVWGALKEYDWIDLVPAEVLTVL